MRGEWEGDFFFLLHRDNLSVSFSCVFKCSTLRMIVSMATISFGFIYIFVDLFLLDFKFVFFFCWFFFSWEFKQCRQLPGFHLSLLTSKHLGEGEYVPPPIPRLLHQPNWENPWLKSLARPLLRSVRSSNR